MSLLDKAKIAPARKVRRNAPSEEDIELVIAWAKGQVSGVQARAALGIGVSSRSFYSWAAFAFRQAVVNGTLIEKERP